MINVEVVKGGSESNTSLIRRFTKRVQGAGILPKVRSLRYSGRPVTKFALKKRALTRIVRRAKNAELAKLGKLVEKKKGRRR